MYKYKKYFYYKNKNGFWVVKISRGDIFYVALDDSKISGKRIFNDKLNNSEYCKKYIDFINEN